MWDQADEDWQAERTAAAYTESEARARSRRQGNAPARDREPSTAIVRTPPVVPAPRFEQVTQAFQGPRYDHLTPMERLVQVTADLEKAKLMVADMRRQGMAYLASTAAIQIDREGTWIEERIEDPHTGPLVRLGLRRLLDTWMRSAADNIQRYGNGGR